MWGEDNLTHSVSLSKGNMATGLYWTDPGVMTIALLYISTNIWDSICVIIIYISLYWHANNKVYHQSFNKVYHQSCQSLVLVIHIHYKGPYHCNMFHTVIMAGLSTRYCFVQLCLCFPQRLHSCHNALVIHPWPVTQSLVFIQHCLYIHTLYIPPP